MIITYKYSHHPFLLGRILLLFGKWVNIRTSDKVAHAMGMVADTLGIGKSTVTSFLPKSTMKHTTRQRSTYPRAVVLGIFMTAATMKVKSSILWA